jgi:ML domain
MKAALVLSAAAAVFSTATASQYTVCESDPVIKVTDVTINPEPVVPGEPLTVSFGGVPTVDITDGTQVEVRANLHFRNVEAAIMCSLRTSCYICACVATGAE